MALLISSWLLPSAHAQANPQPNPEMKACEQETCPEFCKSLDVNERQIGACVKACKQSCAPVVTNPPPATITPKYLIAGLLYAPPGCSTGPAGSTPVCGTNNGSSLVDYNNSSANGTKVSTKDSFQLGVTISYDNSSFPIGGGGSYGFSETTSDSTSVNVTKTQTFDVQALGNGDGVDHGQDEFLLLLHPTVLLKKQAGAILWNFTSGGSLYEVYASELRNPTTMRPSSAQVFNELGFTNADYQAILSEDPYGGLVNPTRLRPIPDPVIGFPGTGTFTTGTNTSPGAGLDPHRFWDTGWSFPYQPTFSSPACNNGVCNCGPISNSLVNDKVSDIGTEDDGQTSVDLYGSVGVPAVYSLKVDTKLIWSTSATSDNTTESKQTATVTITCPSSKYTGDTGMDVWWDTRYGSFVIIPYDPGAVPMLHQGQVLDPNGRAVPAQMVKMIYGGKTYHTFTAPDGSYRFPAPAGKPVLSGTAQILIGKLRQTVEIGAAHRPVVLRMKAKEMEMR